MANVIVVHSPGARLYGVFADDERGKELAARTFAYERESQRTTLAVEPGGRLTPMQRAAMLAVTHASVPTPTEIAEIPSLIDLGYVAIVSEFRGMGLVVTPRGNALLDDGPTP